MSATTTLSFLERRRRSERRRLALSSTTTLVLHLTFAALVVFGPAILDGPPPVIEYKAVPVVSSAALGLPAAEPEATQPARKEPEPTPSPPVEPETSPPEPTAADRPVLSEPSQEKRPLDQPRQPAPSSRPSAGQARQGSPTGSATGTSSAEVSGFDDPDFVYGYYLDQMVGKIRSHWVRPVIGGEVSVVIHFRIHEDGKVSGVRIEQSSGYGNFDLAALRAVQAAAPLPPLPRSYRKSSLGVNLIVR